MGLTFSMLVAALSLSAVLIQRELLWTEAPLAESLAHACAATGLMWALCNLALHQIAPAFVRRETGRDMVAVLGVAALVMGLIVVISMLFVACVEVLCRTTAFSYGHTLRAHIWAGGLVDLAAVAGAAAIHRRVYRSGMLVTSLFWICVLTGLWGALQLEAVREVRTSAGIAQAVYSRDWVGVFMLWTAGVTAVFTIIQGRLEHLRRVAAWPDRLEHLTTWLPSWPGFRHSAGLMGVVILILACVLVTVPWTAVGALAGGAAMLALCHRRWGESLADIGLGLITLGMVSLTMVGLPDRHTEASVYFPAVFSRAAAGLAVMVWFWHWVATIWEDQLDRGAAWTTAGRLIPVSRRVGFIAGVTGVLVSTQLAVWPLLPYVDTRDNSPARWAWGLTGGAMLFLSLSGAARRTSKATLAWLAVLAAAALGVFVLARAVGVQPRDRLVAHWPLVAAGTAAAASLLAGAALRSRTRRAFFEPLLVTGILIGPVLAVMGTALSDAMRTPPWQAPATYALLAVNYLLAALVAGPATLVTVSAVCLAAGAWYLRFWIGGPGLSPGHMAAALAGLILAGSGMVWRHRLGRAAAWGLVAAGAGLAAATLWTGLAGR